MGVFLFLLLRQVRLMWEVFYGLVRFVREGKCIEVEDGSLFWRRRFGTWFETGCDLWGQGKCGKCLVKLNGKIIKACQVKLKC